MLRRAVAGALITVGLLAAGCSDDDGDEGGTTTTESTTTTTEDWTVPDEIDEEYVERVLNELYQTDRRWRCAFRRGWRRSR